MSNQILPITNPEYGGIVRDKLNELIEIFNEYLTFKPELDTLQVDFGSLQLVVSSLNIPTVIDEDNFASDSAVNPPSQQSTKVYVANTLAAAILDEDNFASDSAVKAPSQQSTKAYVTGILNGTMAIVTTLPASPVANCLYRLTTASTVYPPGLYMHDGAGWICCRQTQSIALTDWGSTAISLTLVPGVVYTVTATAEPTLIAIDLTTVGECIILKTGAFAIPEPTAGYKLTENGLDALSETTHNVQIIVQKTESAITYSSASVISLNVKSMTLEIVVESGDIFSIPVAITDTITGYDIPLDYDFTVNWGDDTSSVYKPGDSLSNLEFGVGESVTHTYATAGTYTVVMTGKCESLNGELDDGELLWHSKIQRVLRFDNLGWKILNYCFTDYEKNEILVEFNTHESPTELVYINFMFDEPTVLTTIDLSAWNSMPNLLSCAYLVVPWGQNNLETVNLNGFDVSNIPLWYNPDFGGQGLEYVVIGDGFVLQNLYMNDWVLNFTDGDRSYELINLLNNHGNVINVETNNWSYAATDMSFPIFGVIQNDSGVVNLSCNNFSAPNLVKASFGIISAYFAAQHNISFNGLNIPNLSKEIFSNALFTVDISNTSTLSMTDAYSNNYDIYADFRNGSVDFTGTDFSTVIEMDTFEYLQLDQDSYDHLLEQLSLTILPPESGANTILNMGLMPWVGWNGNKYTDTGLPFRNTIESKGWSIVDGGHITLGGDVVSGDYYLVGNGGPYINTGVTLLNGYDFEYNMYPTGDTNGDITPFGSMNFVPPSTDIAFGCYYDGASGKYMVGWGGYKILAVTPADINSWQTWKKIGTKFEITTIGGEYAIMNTTLGLFSPDQVYPAYIFNANIAGSPATSPLKAKVRYLKIWNSSARTTLMFDGFPVPAGKKAEGASTVAPSNCMYDTVSGTYKENIGTGSFTIESA
jgi:hypothetical protein